MITRNNFLFLLLVVSFGFIPACNKRKRPEPIPTGPVNLTIDLNLPANIHLNNVGTYSYFEGGVRGVIVIHDFDDAWYALERTCAWQPLNSCSIIWADSIELNLRCGTYSGTTFQPCCDSRFSFNGFPSKAPANGRLALYTIQRSGNLLYVYN
jgi:hypothetical protein